MRPYKAPTEAQAAALAHGRFVRESTPCAECGERVYSEQLVRGLCDICLTKSQRASVKRQVTVDAPERTVYLDFETTGLYDAEVVEVGEPAEFGKNRTLTLQASRPRPTLL